MSSKANHYPYQQIMRSSEGQRPVDEQPVLVFHPDFEFAIGNYFSNGDAWRVDGEYQEITHWFYFSDLLELMASTCA